MTSHLFSPITLKGVTLANRIVVSPMCQYSARDGSATDWHLMHLGSFSVAGSGLVLVEATAVEAAGRISPEDLGLYSDANEVALGRVVGFWREYGNTRLGIQLAHAGRKGSAHRPWEKDGAPLSPEEGAWPTVGPSAVSYDENWPPPRALDRPGMEAVKAAFVKAAERAARLGFEVLEMHSAHGYLLHEFLSPLSNLRQDEYGGALENRLRFPLEVFEAMRAVWPEARPLGVRISATDFIPGGWDLADSIIYAAALKERGCDFIDVSGGALAPQQHIEVKLGYQVPYAAAIRREVGIPTIAVGMIIYPQQAEEIIAGGQADMVALARAMLFNPHWAWHAAETLGEEAAYPPQYQLARPARWLRGGRHKRAADE